MASSIIKCPACGSTAQVEMVWQSCSDGRYTVIEREYQCGCGATFEGTFELTNTKLLGVEDLSEI